MKKWIALILVLVLSISLCACGDTTISGGPGLNNGSNTSGTGEEDIQTPKRISKEEIKQYLICHTITADNWQDFYHIVEKKVEQDRATNWYLYPIAEKTFPQNVRIQFQYTSTEIRGKFDANGAAVEETRDPKDKTVTYWEKTFAHGSTWIADIYDLWGNGASYSKYDISDFVCIEASGTLVECVIPEEYWHVNENGSKYIEVDLGDGSFTQIGESQNELDRLEEYLK